MDDSEWYVRGGSIWAVGKLEDMIPQEFEKEIVKKVFAAYKDKDEYVRGYAAATTSKIR